MIGTRCCFVTPLEACRLDGLVSVPGTLGEYDRSNSYKVCLIGLEYDFALLGFCTPLVPSQSISNSIDTRLRVYPRVYTTPWSAAKSTSPEV